NVLPGLMWSVGPTILGRVRYCSTALDIMMRPRLSYWKPLKPSHQHYPPNVNRDSQVGCLFQSAATIHVRFVSCHLFVEKRRIVVPAIFWQRSRHLSMMARWRSRYLANTLIPTDYSSEIVKPFLNFCAQQATSTG